MTRETSRGVTYVAWGKGIREAEASAHSAKRFGLATCLICNEYNGACFDRVILVEERLEFPVQKVTAYSLSPWDVTLFLDTDTVVMGDLSFGFDMATRFGLALVIAPLTFTEGYWNLGMVRAEVPDYNGGVIFFSKEHPGMANFWARLEQEIRSTVDLSGLKDNPSFNDQSALSVFLFENAINPYVLPQNWNLRPQFGMTSGCGPIKILHSRDALPDGFDPNQSSFWRLSGVPHKVLDRK